MSESQEWYQPLDPATAEIRFVTIQPGDWTDKIKCTLMPASLDDQPSYEALSYVWGDPNVRKDIYLNGLPFKVTANLESALRHLRLKGERTIWIDAICINQNDLDERTSQVRIMGKIYGRAVKTVIWLGDARPGSPSPFRLCSKVQVSGDPAQMYWKLNSSDDNVQQLQAYLREEVGAVDEVSDLVALLSRPWWTRIWVVQEAGVSNAVILKCGSDEISWDIFCASVFTLGHAMASGPSLDEVPAGVEKVLIVNTLGMLKILAKTGCPLPMSHLVAWNREAYATDPRDMIFGLLGLATDASASLLDPNYEATNTYLDVFRNLVEHSVRSNKSLDLICMDNKINPHQGWPSWIPNWMREVANADSGIGDLEYKIQPLVPHLSTIHIQFCRFMVASNTPSSNETLEAISYSASLDTEPFAVVDRSINSLAVRGICVDRIRDVSPYQEFTDVGWMICRFDAMEKVMLRCFGNSRHPNSGNRPYCIVDVGDQCYKYAKNAAISTLRPIFRRLWATNYGPLGQLLRRTSRTLKYSSHVDDYIGGGTVVEAYIRTIIADHSIWEGERLGTETSGEFWGHEENEDYCARWANQLRMHTFHRRLVVSEKGYIGLGSRLAQPRDLICVLFGCSVPVILRKIDDYYMFIGESYVHGIMDGEVINTRNERKFSEQEFVLV